MSNTDKLYTELTQNSIYEQHNAAFKRVSAYVVTDAKGERVATVAFKFAASGLRTTCFFHVLGRPMVKAFAAGGGYDKCSAAAHRAVFRIHADAPEVSPKLVGEAMDAICEAIKDEGRSWDGDLRAAGLNVVQAV